MKYCYHCGRITAGEPLFCNACGRSFDRKFCPRLHPNPRSAEICSRCGSRELSTPQPRVSIRWRLLEWLARISLGVLLAILSVVIVSALLTTREIQGALVILGFLLAALWWMWSQLPEWFRKVVRRRINKRKDRNGYE